MLARPPVPEWLDQIRFITHYLLNTCDGPLTLYAELAREPAGRLALMLITPDMGEIVQGFFTPKGLRSKRHGRKGRRGEKGPGGIPDVDEMVSEKIPGSQEMAGRHYGMGQRFFFAAANEVDRVSWNLALVEMSTEFVYSDLLAVIQDPRADCPNVGRLNRHGANIVVLDGPGFAAVPIPVVQYEHNVHSPTYYGADYLGKLWLVVIAFRVLNDQPNETTIKCRIVRGTDPSYVFDESPHVTLQPGDVGTVMTSTVTGGPDSVIWEFGSDRENCLILSADAFIQQME